MTPGLHTPLRRSKWSRCEAAPERPTEAYAAYAAGRAEGANEADRTLSSPATPLKTLANETIEGEVEWSRKKQASQVGFSLLGDVLPAPVDPRANLNNQPWVQPSKFDALTGSLRYTQALVGNWRVVGQMGSQHLTNDDFTAFPFSRTVHAPQLPVSQPTWVPVRSRSSRMKWTSSRRASTSRS